MQYDYYRAYRDGDLISEGDLPVPADVEEQAHEIHWYLKEHFRSPEDEGS